MGNFNTGKIIYNWLPFMKVVYRMLNFRQTSVRKITHFCNPHKDMDVYAIIISTFEIQYHLFKLHKSTIQFS